jgi:hypothetical protein
LRLNGPLLLVTTIIVVLIHVHFASRWLQVGLLRLRRRLWRSLRLHRRGSLGRRLRLWLRRRRKLLSGRYRCRLLLTLLCGSDARRGLRVDLRWSKGRWVVSGFGRVVILSSTTLIICTSHL